MWFDDQGVVELGGQVGGRGGEGCVFEVRNRQRLLAKIYHQAPAPRKVDKLEYLARSATLDLLLYAAWPRSLLRDDTNRVRGFLMPWVQGKEIHQLLAPKERFLEFPGKGWDFLVHVARNCAAAFESAHEAGAVIGDVNEGNFLVGRDGIARLIDCDSFQVSNGSSTWSCDVGVEFWTPPELQGCNFRGLRRTANHDRFGLAVLIFKLLFMNRHPFSGVNAPELSQAIKEFLFAFSAQAANRGVRPPPYSLPITSFPDSYRELFERAFLKGSENDARPHARQWVQALDVLLRNLSTCQQDASHKYPRNLRICPWCEIARAGGPHFFLTVTMTVPVSGANLASVWETIVRMQRVSVFVPPLDHLKFPSVQPAPLQPQITAVRAGFVVGALVMVLGLILTVTGSVLLGLAITMLGCGMVTNGVYSPEYAVEKRRRRDILAQKRRELISKHQEFSHFATSFSADFDQKRNELQKTYERMMRLDEERATELRRLEAAKWQLQLNEFLDKQLISRSDIPGLGPIRKSRLLHYGIESALDVTPDMSVPGFGPKNVRLLLAWRQKFEWRFTYDPSKGVPAQELNQVNARFSGLRHQLGSELEKGAKLINTLNATARARADQLQAQFETLLEATAQAEADLNAFTH